MSEAARRVDFPLKGTESQKPKGDLRIISRDGETVPPTEMSAADFQAFQEEQARQIAGNHPDDSVMLEVARLRAQKHSDEIAKQKARDEAAIRRQQEILMEQEQEAAERRIQEVNQEIDESPEQQQGRADLKQRRMNEAYDRSVEASTGRVHLETFAMMNDALRGSETLTTEQRGEIDKLITATKEALRLDTPQGLAQARDLAERANNLKMRADRINKELRVQRITLTNPKAAPTGFFANVKAGIKSLFSFGRK